MITIETKNDIQYKVLNNIYYKIKTPDKVIEVLDVAYRNNLRIRLFYGDIETGKDWIEDCQTIGYVKCTGGMILTPILLLNKASHGGCSILTDCIVKITLDKKVIYQHDNYYLNENDLTSDWELLNMEFFSGNTNKKKKMEDK